MPFKNMFKSKDEPDLGEMFQKLGNDLIHKTKLINVLKIDRDILMRVFDALNEPVYVVDMDTFDILYINDYIRNNFGNIEGKKCYEVLQQDIAPCHFCRIPQLEEEYKPIKWTHKNPITRKWYRIVDMKIPWLNGHQRNAKLQIAIELTESFFKTLNDGRTRN